MTIIEKIEDLDKKIKQVFLLENEIIHPKIDTELTKLASQHVLLKEYLSSLIKDELSIKKVQIYGRQQALLINNMYNTYHNDREISYTTHNFVEKYNNSVHVSSIFSPLDLFEPKYNTEFFVMFGKKINIPNTNQVNIKHVNTGERYIMDLVNKYLKEDFKNFYQKNKKSIKENNHFIFNMTLLLLPLNEIKFDFNSIFDENKLYSKKDIYNILKDYKEVIMLNTDIDISEHLNKISIFDSTKNMSKP